MNQTFFKTKIIAVVIIILISCCSVLPAQNADIKLLRKINVDRNENLDNMFRFFSGSATPVSIAIPVLLLGKGLVMKDCGDITKGLTIGSSVILASIISTSIKYSFNRTRPFITYPDIDKATSAGSPSFPSGHTSDAFSTATALTLAYPKWYIAVPSYTWAAAVGYSRMHLGVHYPVDVLSGALTGSLSAYLCYKGQKWINKKRLN